MENPDNELSGEKLSTEIVSQQDDALPKDSKHTRTNLAEYAESYEGIIPHPRHFREFEETHPGAAKWFLDAATEERRHRHAMERMIAKQVGLMSILTALLGWLVIIG